MGFAIDRLMILYRDLATIWASNAFKILKDDSNAQWVLYFHGAADTLDSGWRDQSYWANVEGLFKHHQWYVGRVFSRHIRSK